MYPYLVGLRWILNPAPLIDEVRRPIVVNSQTMQKRILIAATAALLSLPLVLNAADEGKKKGGGFGAVDTDGDGKISKTEFVAYSKTRGMEEKPATDRFAALDTDKNGSLSREEFAAAGGGKKKEGDGKKKTEK
jgi:hypothetical protein